MDVHLDDTLPEPRLDLYHFGRPGVHEIGHCQEKIRDVPSFALMHRSSIYTWCHFIVLDAFLLDN